MALSFVLKLQRTAIHVELRMVLKVSRCTMDMLT